VTVRRPDPAQVPEVEPVEDEQEGARADGPTKRCRFCAETIKADAIKCRFCGERLDRPAKVQAPRRRGSPVLQLIGAVLLIGGLLFAVGYYNMDTSVEVPATYMMGERLGGGRVNNLGLMDDRRNGLLVSLAAAGGGLVLLLVGRP
jgi:hypothetical protein